MWRSHSPPFPALGIRLETNCRWCCPGFPSPQLRHSCSPDSPGNPGSLEIIMKWFLWLWARGKAIGGLHLPQGTEGEWEPPGDAASHQHNRTQIWPGPCLRSKASCWARRCSSSSAPHSPARRWSLLCPRGWTRNLRAQFGCLRVWWGEWGKHNQGYMLCHC